MTDSGIWKFTVVNNTRIVAAERHRYLARFEFENDTLGSFCPLTLRDSQSILDTFQVKWSDGQLQAYAEPLVDKDTGETIIEASQGVVERIDQDTLQIRWHDSFVNKFKRVGLSDN